MEILLLGILLVFALYDSFRSPKIFFVLFADLFFIVVDSSSTTKFNLFLDKKSTQPSKPLFVEKSTLIRKILRCSYLFNFS